MSSFRRRIMMQNGTPEIISGIPPLVTNKNKLLRLKAFGGTEQNGTPTSDTPVDIVSNNGVLKVNSQGQIYTDGTVETINAHGKNLFDKNNTLTGYYDASGVWINSSSFVTADYIPAKPNTTYVASVVGILSQTTGFRLHAWDKDHNWLGQVAYAVSSQVGQSTVISGTSPANTTYLSLGFSEDPRDIDTCQLEVGSTATEYEPYFDGGTATAEMLLKVGDYQDEQEILSGVITRNVRVKVLDGTEGWQLETATDLVQFYTSSTQGVIANNVSLTSTIAPYGCTAATRTQYDFGCYSGGSGNLCFQMKGSATLTTATAWAQWLAAQYNAGTPVIIIYPLATPTTESVAGQTLTLTSGTNVIDITQASLNDLELEVTAK